MVSAFTIFTLLRKYPAHSFHRKYPSLTRKQIFQPFKPGKAMHSMPSWRHMLIIVAGSLFFSYTCSSAAWAENRHSQQTEFEGISPDIIIDQIKVMYIYEVQNGRLRPRVFTGNDLKIRKAIQVNGYISGIVLFTTERMTVAVADQRMDAIQVNRDGTYELKYFGNFRRRELLTAFSDSENPVDDLPDLDQMAGRYCYFPKIRGDAISKKKIFNITLSVNNVTLTIPVNQTGSRTFYNTDPVSFTSPNSLAFQDIGNSLTPFDIASSNFKQRIASLSKGIETAESGFQIKLVDTINILNYNGLDNAYTFKDKKEIWMYKQTFWGVSVQELHSLAEHEACHILVDRADLTLNSALRNHYADLKGFGDFSKERFMLVTHGSISGADSTGKSQNSFFFAFINEKNFIQGMTGGHSQDDLEEFYASFLHSMLYIDRLYTNLKNPITLPGGRKHLLTESEQRKIVGLYKHTVKLITTATQKNPNAEYLSLFLQTIEPKLEHGPAFGSTTPTSDGRDT